MRQFEFVGFDEKGTFYGEAALTIGKIYNAAHVDGNEYKGVAPALQIDQDDFGISGLYEELRGFKEVTPVIE